jgi:GNAT superfamily N-acetyltransferase
MDFRRLADRPEHVETAARWIWEEWREHSSLSLAETRARLLLDVDRPSALLALEGEIPAGVLGFGRFQRAAGEPESLFIDALYVAPEFRGTGIGTALLREGVTRAREFASELFVYTHLREWYERRGWTTVETTPGSELAVLVIPLGAEA